MSEKINEQNVARSIAQLLQDYSHELSMLNSLDRVTLQHFLDALHERGFGVVLLVLALPMALPVPVPPVLNVLLSLPLLFLTVQQIMGAHTIWLPAFIRLKQIDRLAMVELINKVVPFLRKLEALTKPRMGVFTTSWSQKISGIFMTVMALSVMVPLPLTNTVPSFGIAVMALGILMRDGLAVLLGAIGGMIWVMMLFSALILFGAEGIDIIKEAIKSVI